ncbi:MAG: PilX N-terminal domain-containing pilus assembly protein [Thermodesulfobacteriota bacterium]|nr:PilX N-terminal domain-containing pilus assembly protein [Thermodesulfobacteriota bacterium]
MKNEEGFTLILSLMVLLLLSLMGMWALNTSDIEIGISGNEQRYQENFNIAEGSTYLEASALGFASNPYYAITDPSNFNLKLGPNPSDNDYDPGHDMDPTVLGNLSTLSAIDVKKPEEWPHQNLLRDTSDNKSDYSYLVTYLYQDVPPKGYDTDSFSSYKFKINGARNTEIEIGGVKVGPKATI